MIAKRGRVSEEPAHCYDHDKFVNESTTEKFGLISKNRSFIKEKGFHHVRPEKFQFLEKGQNHNFDFKIVISVKNPKFIL